MMSKKRKRFIVILVTFIVVSIVSVPVWRTLYFRCDEVDIHTGRIRTTRNLLFCQISEKIEDSVLTETIGTFDENMQPDWKRVNKFFLFYKYSPHYGYHGAINQIEHMDRIWRLFNFSDGAKKHMAQNVLDKWQAEGKYFGVTMYLLEVSKVCYQKEELDPNATISVADLETIDIE